jgi:dihydrofolate reductase
MPKLRLRISVSLDGFVAGPNQSVDTPLGVGGERLHDWVVPLEVWRKMHGMQGGAVNESTSVLEEEGRNIGATIMGRNMFGPIRGPWPDDSWRGWWGDEPPYHHAVFVLTHHARDPLEMQGGTTFHFVTDGIESALGQAFDAAAGKDVRLGGGASAVQQYLRAGLVDEMHVAQVNVLLGGGARLFEEDVASGYTCVERICTPSVTHLRFQKRA